MNRDQLEQVVQRALARVAADSSRGVLSLASVNRARRDIMHAAGAYRAWLPDADPPTPTESFLQREHRRTLQSALYTGPRPGPRARLSLAPDPSERPSP